MEAVDFGRRFLFGTATASAQIEGGDKNNTWYKWCKEGHIEDKSSTYTACDHWKRVREDTDLLDKMNVQTHRMSLEWSRIEPEKGRFDESALRHYREEIKLLRSYRIKPLVTLHHFSEPLWFEELGGWQRKGNAKLFTEYAAFVVERLGDLVSDWVTFNEPNVYALFGYAVGCFPPGVRNIFEWRRVQAQLVKTHIELYRMIHAIREEKGYRGGTRVGAAIHIRIFDGLTGLGKLTARAADYLSNDLAMEGMTTGKLLFPLSLLGRGHNEPCADFIGINYYTRNIVEFALDPRNYFHRCLNDSDLDKNDLGWDIYPEGIYRACKKYEKYGLPIYITENGISDQKDNRRPAFIADHLACLARAISEGVKVERYYHWTLMDNFEWLNGEQGFFGLYCCDFKTQERQPRKSAEFYAQICKNRAITDKMLRDINPDII